MKPQDGRPRELVALRHPTGSITEVTHMRGTIVVTGWAHLRSLERTPAYWDALDPRARDRLRRITASEWVPHDLSAAHCRAIGEALGGPSDWRRLGRVLSERTQGNWVNTLLRALRVAGMVNATSLMARFQTAWDRTFQGGAARVLHTGPRSIIVECHEVPLVAIPAFRHAWAGMLEHAVGLVERGVTVEILEARSTERTLVMRILWAPSPTRVLRAR